MSEIDPELLAAQRRLEQRREQQGLTKTGERKDTSKDISEGLESVLPKTPKTQKEIFEEDLRGAMSIGATGDRDTMSVKFVDICKRHDKNPLLEAKKRGVDLLFDTKKQLKEEIYENLEFEAQFLTLATLPHRKPKLIPSFDENARPVLTKKGEPVLIEQRGFVRKNGNYTLEMTCGEAGLPYGVMPRLLLTFLVSEAVRTKDPTIQLGKSVRSFFDKIGLVDNGQKYAIIREQAERLFHTTFHLKYSDGKRKSAVIETIGHKYDMWWDDKASDEQETLFTNHVELSLDFFNEITTHRFPVDLRVIREIKDSSLALDIYKWLTFRASYLNKEAEIPWGSLVKQFGANYSRVRDFRADFIIQLQKVAQFYKEVPLFVDTRSKEHLLLLPGENLTSIKMLK